MMWWAVDLEWSCPDRPHRLARLHNKPRASTDASFERLQVSGDVDHVGIGHVNDHCNMWGQRVMQLNLDTRIAGNHDRQTRIPHEHDAKVVNLLNTPLPTTLRGPHAGGNGAIAVGARRHDPIALEIDRTPLPSEIFQI